MTRVGWALLKAETIKLRRTAAPVVAVATPVLVSFMQLFGLLNRKDTFWPPAEVVWAGLLKGQWTVWLAFFVPVLISFMAASLAGLEHSGNQWKQLFAFPIPRWWVYAMKMLSCGLLVGVSFEVFTLAFIGNALIYGRVDGLDLASAVPWGTILAVAGKAFLACWIVIVIQTWLSTRISGFGAAIGSGAAGLIFGYMLSSIGDKGDWGRWYPWMLPFSTNPPGGMNVHNTLLPALVGALGGLLLGALACRDLASRREHA